MEYGYLDKEVKALVAERDRLAAENAELRATIETISTERNLFLQQRTEAIDKGVYWQDKSKTHERMFRAANATLDRLREAIRTQHAELFYVTAAKELRVGFDAKKEAKS